jgi:hypothetical protein
MAEYTGVDRARRIVVVPTAMKKSRQKKTSKKLFKRIKEVVLPLMCIVTRLR